MTLPLENCPLCDIKVRWILSDGISYYDCSNKDCPIKFNERLYFPESMFGSNDIKDSLLIYYQFEINSIPVIMYFGGGPFPQNHKMIIFPKFTFIKMIGGDIVTDQIKIDWSNLSLLENKIRTIINFS